MHFKDNVFVVFSLFNRAADKSHSSGKAAQNWKDTFHNYFDSVSLWTQVEMGINMEQVRHNLDWVRF